MNLESKISKCQNEVKLWDKVRFWADGTVKHHGFCVKITTSGLHIFRPKKNTEDTEGDVSIDSAQWFPFRHKAGGITFN